MKKNIRTLAAALLAALTAAFALSGCGGSKAPSSEDAKKYTQAVMDLMCTGEYDSSVEFSDIQKGEGAQARDEVIDGIVSSLTEDLNADGEVEEQLRDFMVKAFSKCRYTVGEPVKTEDGKNTGYDVPVSVEPLKVFEGSSEAIQKEADALASDTNRLMNMTEEELYSAIYSSFFQTLNANLDNPQYAPAQEVVLHFGIIDEEKKAYGISPKDGEKIGAVLFSLEGLEAAE